ncbi:MAG: hypothetical protein M9911_00165 [Saprospiraceae bacterium]|nr:hypothetical protein [Saprospiraceae bacterium]
MKKIFIVGILAILFSSNINAWPKWVKYVGEDFGGAIAGAQIGAQVTLGNPLGISAGIVAGGVCRSVWVYHWDHNLRKNMNNGNTGIPLDSYEKVGYIHNQVVGSFINEHPDGYPNIAMLSDVIYEPIVSSFATVYGIEKQDVYSILSKQSFVNEMNKLSSVGDIQQNALIIKNTYGDEKLSSFYMGIMNRLISAHNNNYDLKINIDNFCQTEILNIENTANYSAKEKDILKYSINILKYSYNFWFVNKLDLN